MVTYIDDRFVDDGDATVSVRSRALNYGLGCFGGIRGYLADDKREVFVFRLDQHVQRLERSAKLIALALPVDQARAREIVIELLRRNKVRHDVYVRPMVIAGRSS
jgi:branched-chain amino acid aminotransferase